MEATQLLRETNSRQGDEAAGGSSNDQSTTMYPPRPRPTGLPSSSQSSLPLAKHIVGSESYELQPTHDPERAAGQAHKPGSSWDLLSGVKRFEHSYEEFDSRHATDPHLVFAEGDLPNNKVSTHSSHFSHYQCSLDL